MSKKNKTTMSLAHFLNDNSSGSWADETDDLPTGPSAGYGGGQPSNRYNDQYSAPQRGGGYNDRERSYDRGFDRREGGRDAGRGFSRSMPTEPPFTAFVGNIDYEVTQDELAEFLGASYVKNVRIVTDRETGRPKGYGYVEFFDLDGLKSGLELNGERFRGRDIKLDVAEPTKPRPTFGGRRDEERENKADSASTWRRETPLPPPTRRDDRMERQDRPGSHRGGFGHRNDDRPRGGRFGDRDGERGFGGRGGFNNGGSRQYSSNSMNDGERPSSSTVGERKRLQLAPRSKPLNANENASTTAKSTKSAKPNPFGDAKPVDTTAALRKVEKKLEEVSIEREEAPAQE